MPARPSKLWVIQVRIEKKAWPEIFERVLSGEKQFDLRLADREYGVGDTLVLREWDPDTKEYTGRVVEKKITYVLKTKDNPFWPEEEVARKGYVVMSLK